MIGAKVLLGGALVAGVAAVLALPDSGREGTTPPAGEPGAGAGILFASLPRGSDPLARGRLPAGSRILRAGLPGAGGEAAAPAEFLPGFAAAGDPHVSFDGATVLFAGREREEDRDGIHEARPDGSGVRRVASLEGGDCRSPVRMPDGSIVFEGPAPGEGAPGEAAARALFSVDPAGDGLPRRITFHASGSDGDPLVLNDGRILFVRRGAGGARLLWVHGDGTFVHPFHGRGLPEADRFRPREAEDRALFLLERAPGGGAAAARRIDPRRPDRPSAEALPGLPGEVAAVEPLPGGDLLVSHRPAAGRPTFGLRRIRPGGPPEGIAVLDDPDREEADPVLLAPRRRPQGHLATVDPSRARGELFCIDARRLDGPSSGRGGPRAEAVRFHESLPSGGERLLGTVPLDPDGSFYVALPPDRPLRVESLAADGTVLDRSGFDLWVRPGEVRGCIGCHEDPAVSPPNVFPRAVERDPVDLGRGAPAGGAR